LKNHKSGFSIPVLNKHCVSEIDNGTVDKRKIFNDLQTEFFFIETSITKFTFDKPEIALILQEYRFVVFQKC